MSLMKMFLFLFLRVSKHTDANGASKLMRFFCFVDGSVKESESGDKSVSHEKSEWRASSTSEHTSALHPLPHGDRVASRRYDGVSMTSGVERIREE